MSNIFVVNKPQGPTSFQIIAEIKKITGEQKVGHAGTLDPLAEGVLVVGVGREATRQINSIVQSDKEYLAELELGKTSTTDDAEGQIKQVSDQRPSRTEIQFVINKYLGQIQQIPPQYSAIKVGGQRSYKAARAGRNLQLKARSVQVKEIKIIKYDYPKLKLRITTGKGVYIRSLARDIGHDLGVGAYLTALKRTRVGKYSLQQAVSMAQLESNARQAVVEKIKHGQIGVMPTDTIYGLVGLALNREVVERIYTVRRRRPDKPFIILIGSINELKKFKINLNKATHSMISKYWPGPVSIILDCPNSDLEYLHRGAKSLAFRLPKNKQLIDLLKKTGPLVAPSANLEGHPPALTIKQAKKYFSNQVDFYVNQGKLVGKPSTLIRIDNGQAMILRP